MRHLQPAYTSSSARIRTWTTFKAAFQGETIKKFRLSLGDSKVTLLLIRQDLSDCSTPSRTMSSQPLPTVSQISSCSESQRQLLPQ
ncbi:hypothetical protein VTN77DRAFT_1227 [Rasamsonia byssochlamydoides]|uniref:uncharacterized protein n=1 Tax=Rasamsonia byssochlamydoides TaxID=89139 RepID=UPI0037440B64